MDATAQPWSQPEQLDVLPQMSNDFDDLENLFEFGDIDLNNIPNLESTQYGGTMQDSHHSSHPSTPFDDMGPTVPPGTSAQDFGTLGQYSIPRNLSQQQFVSPDAAQPPRNNPYTANAFQPSVTMAYHHPNSAQLQYQHQSGLPGYQVPPTPNSFDMHGEAGHFLQQPQQLDPQQRAILEQRFQLRKDDVTAFTPMLSPADTPQYNMQPEFTVPGAYFSPLTSPMLHAQNAQYRHTPRSSYTDPSTAQNSNATSPVDPKIDFDMLGEIISLPEPATTSRPERPKRKPATPRTLANAKGKQAPLQKVSQKRKSGSMLSLVTQKSAETLVAEAHGSASLQPGSAGLHMPSTYNRSSDDGSISPQPLSDLSMGPPPRPASRLTHSPAIVAQQQQDPKVTATPESLLSRSSENQPFNSTDQGFDSAKESAALDDLQLPEAAADQTVTRSPLAQIDTQMTCLPNEQSLRTSARKTPKLGPLSTPSSARSMSALASPAVAGSPISTGTPGALLKDMKDGKGSRSNKKRGSVGASSSAHVSPALRPRISPSIKPLLPEGTPLHSPTHALLLASKSNYQNILEGNHVPGVSYPDSLSTGLSSKRTSHKVAEQGRRNRINDALKEMQSLVPKPALMKAMKESSGEGSPDNANAADADGGKESKEDAAAKNSKAATVEMANVYIRGMQQTQKEMEARLAELEQKTEEMAKQLAERGGGTTAGSTSGKEERSSSPDVQTASSGTSEKEQ